MPLETACLSYAALAALAVATHKQRSMLARWSLPTTIPVPVLARTFGTAGLILALLLAMHRSGFAQGMVAWAAQLCLSGVSLVLLLSWRPRFALALSLPALALAAGMFAMVK